MSGAKRRIANGLVFMAFAWITGDLACKGEKGGGPSGGNSSGTSSSASNANGSSNVPAPASGSASAKGAETATATATFTGSYDSKAAAVQTPDSAPPFENEESGLLGPGTLSFVLPAGDGEVTGESTGALGTLKLHGMLEGTRLTAQATPDPTASPAMWGTLLADVQGSGDARTVTGALRASSDNGHVVREATFTLRKK